MEQEDEIAGHKTVATGGASLKMWTAGVPVEGPAVAQLMNIAKLPFIHSHVAVMPDVHVGIGATVGSVIPTRAAIIPAAVGVDIGCGMCAVQTSLKATDLPDNLAPLRTAIEATIPVGKDVNAQVDQDATVLWRERFETGAQWLRKTHPKISTKAHPSYQIGSLGGGNHFVEICLDEADRVWVMLHSGSRGIGNRIGTYFIERAKKNAARDGARLPDQNLAWFDEGTADFDDYVRAVAWAQDFAAANRALMLKRVLRVMRKAFKGFKATQMAVNCHHNYVARETHFGADIWVTRKGAVRARADDLGIIPGSMGARSYIVRGKGNAASFASCAHGAGRAMSRRAAKEAFTLAHHRAATEGVECRKDKGVLDETPGAYKDIDAVMAAQAELVDIVHTLKQVVCVKG